MDIEFNVYGALCEMETFRINNVDADIDDFGSKGDHSPETAEDYTCGDMRFTRNESSSEVLTKYGITQEEYNDICSRLEKELSFGSCGWCL